MKPGSVKKSGGGRPTQKGIGKSNKRKLGRTGTKSK